MANPWIIRTVTFANALQAFHVQPSTAASDALVTAWLEVRMRGDIQQEIVPREISEAEYFVRRAEDLRKPCAVFNAPDEITQAQDILERYARRTLAFVIDTWWQTGAKAITRQGSTT